MNTSYTDSRGAEMDGMSFSQALVVIYDLANGNQIDEHDMAFGDPGLVEQHRWQQQALDVVLAVLAHHRGSIDALPASTQAGDWDQSLVSATRDMNPLHTGNAIRICLSLAEEGALDPADAGREPELADEVDRQQVAIDIVRDLLGMHGESLERIQVASSESSFSPGA